MDKAKRTPIIAGNWKMNKTPDQTFEFINEVKPLLSGADCKVIFCVPFVDIKPALDAAKGSNIEIGAQNCHFEKSGAYTGEISAEMLKSMGVNYVIIGHSERRQYFAETDETVNKRLKAAIAEGLNVILCVGETLSEREADITAEIVSMQLKIALDGVSADDMKKIIIAYEPVWAIGTGKTATSDQAQEVCAILRDLLKALYSKEIAEKTVIQYGGSMNAQNADELLSKPDVDGGLIGGASLKSNDFSLIVKAASK